MHGFISYLLISLWALTACQTDKNIHVDVYIKGLPADTKYYWKSSDGLLSDSGITRINGFSCKIPVNDQKGDLYYFELERPDEPEITFSQIFSVYLKDGPVRISSEGPFFSNAKVTGDQATLDYNEFRNYLETSTVVKRQYKIYSLMRAGADSVSINVLNKELESLYPVRRDMVTDWISKHPASEASAAILYTEVLNEDNFDLVYSLANKINASAKRNYLGQKLQKYLDFKLRTAIGKPAIPFTQPDTAGKKVSLEDYRGKYVLIDFWASWCGPCREENPNLLAAYRKYSSRNFDVLGVSVDSNRELWLKAVHQDSLPWVQVSDLKGFKNEAAEIYHIESIPSNLLLNKEGIIIAKNLRGKDLEIQLSQLIP